MRSCVTRMYPSAVEQKHLRSKPAGFKETVSRDGSGLCCYDEYLQAHSFFNFSAAPLILQIIEI